MTNNINLIDFVFTTVKKEKIKENFSNHNPTR